MNTLELNTVASNKEHRESEVATILDAITATFSYYKRSTTRSTGGYVEFPNSNIRLEIEPHPIAHTADLFSMVFVRDDKHTPLNNPADNFYRLKTIIAFVGICEYLSTKPESSIDKAGELRKIRSAFVAYTQTELMDPLGDFNNEVVPLLEAWSYESSGGVDSVISSRIEIDGLAGLLEVPSDFSYCNLLVAASKFAVQDVNFRQKLDPSTADYIENISRIYQLGSKTNGFPSRHGLIDLLYRLYQHFGIMYLLGSYCRTLEPHKGSKLSRLMHFINNYELDTMHAQFTNARHIAVLHEYYKYRCQPFLPSRDTVTKILNMPPSSAEHNIGRVTDILEQTEEHNALVKAFKES